MVGAVIGNYQIIRKLGAGGMGAVYLGQHALLGRRAAIKVLLPSLSARQDVVKRFFNEARAVTTISDPGIVQVFDFGYHADGSAYIVMEFLEGEALDRRIAKRGKLAISEALRIGQQLATSLAAAHEKRIIHRDLKPENIFLVRDSGLPSGERTKILDFGIAKLSSDQPGKSETHTGVLLGTPKYMSPEQCRGVSKLDHRSDIYSLGCVLFHVLTGRPPFDGDGVSDIISAQLRDPAPPPSQLVSEVPEAVDAIVRRCLSKTPGERFPSMTELAAALGEAVLLISSPAIRESSPALSPRGEAAVPSSAALPVQPPSAPLPPTASTDGNLPATIPPGAATPPPMTVLPPTATTLPQPTPTTLGDSSGQFLRQPERSSRVGRWIAVTLVACAVVLGIIIIRPHDDAPIGTATANPAVVAGHGEPAAPPAPPAPPAAIVDAGPGAPPAPVATPRADIGPGEPPGSTTGSDQDEITMDDAPGEHAEPPGRPVVPSPAEPDDPAMPAPPPQGGHPPSTPAIPSRPQTRPPAPKKCGKADFASVYQATAPANPAIHAALKNLNACRNAGVISQDEFERTQAALISRLH